MAVTLRKGMSEPSLGASPAAVLRFRHTATGSGVSRRGVLRPGGQLRIEYDPARLPPSAEIQGATWDVVCHARFGPRGQHHSGSVVERGGAVSQAGTPRHLPLDLAIPADATEVELWFESRGAAGTTGWDSRYGRNYSFAILSEGLPVPEPSVDLRADAVIDPARIRVVADAATKETTPLGATGKRLHTGLVVRAVVAKPAQNTDAWADIHVFDAVDELIHAATVALQYRELNPEGALFVWEDHVYQGSGGGSGIGVWSRPDAHTVQYRLYCQDRPVMPGEQPHIFTDGVLHEFEVPADEDVGGS